MTKFILLYHYPVNKLRKKGPCVHAIHGGDSWKMVGRTIFPGETHQLGAVIRGIRGPFSFGVSRDKFPWYDKPFFPLTSY